MASHGPAERLALAALTQAIPTSMVEEALRTCGRVAERVRTLPPWVTTYHMLTSALCPSAGYDDVTELVWSTLPQATGRALARRRPTRGAITRARARVGAQPLAYLLGELVRRVSAVDQNDSFYLVRSEFGGGQGTWWICAADSLALRGADPSGDDPAAAAGLVRGVEAARVVLCSSGPESERRHEVHRLVEGICEVSVGQLPPDAVVPWAGLRARTDGAWQQDVLARACVEVAVEAVLLESRMAMDHRPQQVTKSTD